MEAVARSAVHAFSKEPVPVVRLLAGLGVDAHAGRTVQHLSRVRRDPSQPNLRQVHLLQSELIDELIEAGFHVAPGALGENVTTRGVALLDLLTGTLLHLGEDAMLEVTGLRTATRLGRGAARKQHHVLAAAGAVRAAPSRLRLAGQLPVSS